ncbi:hypothetical protein, partial [Paenibacillus tianmuensis]|uniref:hypothetical protein n=1 Tax=Paenibacillus tianmuensis TaxID=624147 RepID=UPI001C253590
MKDRTRPESEAHAVEPRVVPRHVFVPDEDVFIFLFEYQVTSAKTFTYERLFDTLITNKCSGEIGM